MPEQQVHEQPDDSAEHAPPSFREAPDGMETKSTAGSTIGYNPAPVPHLNRVGSGLDDDERRRADQHGDLAHGFSGMPEGDADNGGITTASGGTQSKSAVGSKAASGPRSTKAPAEK